MIDYALDATFRSFYTVYWVLQHASPEYRKIHKEKVLKNCIFLTNRSYNSTNFKHSKYILDILRLLGVSDDEIKQQTDSFIEFGGGGDEDQTKVIITRLGEFVSDNLFQYYLVKFKNCMIQANWLFRNINTHSKTWIFSCFDISQCGMIEEKLIYEIIETYLQKNNINSSLDFEKSLNDMGFYRNYKFVMFLNNVYNLMIHAGKISDTTHEKVIGLLKNAKLCFTEKINEIKFSHW